MYLTQGQPLTLQRAPQNNLLLKQSLLLTTVKETTDGTLVVFQNNKVKD